MDSSAMSIEADLSFFQPTFSGSPMRHSLSDQQSSFDDLSMASVKPIAPPAAPVRKLTFHQAAPSPGGARRDISNHLVPSDNQGMEASGVGQWRAPPGSPDSQVSSPTSTYFSESSMSFLPNQLSPPEVGFDTKLLLPQLLQPVSTRAVQSPGPLPTPPVLQPAPSSRITHSQDCFWNEINLARIKIKLMIFRINQQHNGSVRDRDSALKSCSELGLAHDIAQEYRIVLEQAGGIPLFVRESADWDVAFELLGEIVFRLFRSKELERAQRMDEMLPALGPILGDYFASLSPHPELEKWLHEVQETLGEF